MISVPDAGEISEHRQFPLLLPLGLSDVPKYKAAPCVLNCHNLLTSVFTMQRDKTGSCCWLACGWGEISRSPPSRVARLQPINFNVASGGFVASSLSFLQPFHSPSLPTLYSKWGLNMAAVQVGPKENKKVDFLKMMDCVAFLLRISTVHEDLDIISFFIIQFIKTGSTKLPGWGTSGLRARLGSMREFSPKHTHLPSTRCHL